MAGDWIGVNQSLRELGEVLAGNAMERRKRKQTSEDMINQLLMKAQIEVMVKKQAMKDMFDMYQQGGYFGGQGGQPGAIDTTAQVEPGVVGVNRGMADYVRVPTGIPESPFKLELNPEAALRRKVDVMKERAKVVQGTNLNKQISNLENKIREYKTVTGPIIKDIDRVLKTWKEIPSHQTGPLQRWLPGAGLGAYSLKAGGKSTKGMSEQELANLTPEERTEGRTASPLTVYMDTRDMIMANISRTFGGEKGVLNDRDILRIQNAWPSQSDDISTAGQKTRNIKQFIQDRVDEFNKNSSVLINQWGNRGYGETRDIQETDLQQDDFSTMSDEELRNIAAGG